MEAIRSHSFLDVLRNRRSRRFALGMKLDGGPLSYASRQPSLALSDDEEAMLAFAAAGITGYALGDLAYGPDKGGTIMSGFVGQTYPAGDGIHSVAVVVTN